MDNRSYIQNINGTVTGNVNMAGRDVNISNANTDPDRIYEILSEIKCCIEDINKTYSIANDEKENVMDDIAVIEEQSVSGNPSIVKLRKAIAGILGFTKSLPDKIAGATMLVTKVTELQDIIQEFIDNIQK